ncbi:hypothetical protein IAI19_11645, partial [Streptococcus pseudopneumoniae]|uniref:hypothetical protein n=1 Tax=Streptococcus pseudopneumoniae TaxID=257758 RepID=UPI0019D66626
PWYEDTEASLTGDREVDRVLVTVRSLSPEQRELTIVALGDIAVTAPVTDSSVETETSTEDCCCDTCGGMTPADSNFCCCCGADMA